MRYEKTLATNTEVLDLKKIHKARSAVKSLEYHERFVKIKKQ